MVPVQARLLPSAVLYLLVPAGRSPLHYEYVHAWAQNGCVNAQNFQSITGGVLKALYACISILYADPCTHPSFAPGHVHLFPSASRPIAYRNR